MTLPTARGAALIPLFALLLGAGSARPVGPSFRFDRLVRPPEPVREAPIRLTSSEGVGLELTRLSGRAVVQGPLAFTELRLSFQNPEDRVIEGRFRIALPPGASLSRFAMRLEDGRWQEGEVVEKVKARAAYEDFLHRRQDPALLEQAAGNEFSARVFPIPARATKELILSYSQELTLWRPRYVLPLRGLPRVDELDLALAEGGKTLAELKRHRFAPDSDFEANVPGGGVILRSGNLAAVRTRVPLPGRPDPVASLLVLFDTSASRALGLETQLALLKDLARGLAAGAGPDVPLSVIAFDQDAVEAFSGTAGRFGDEALRKIRDRRAMGASDLGRALDFARLALGRRPAGRVLILTDGLATAGELEAKALKAKAKALAAAGAERLDAVALGGLRDEESLKALVTAGLPRDGAVVDGSLGVEAVARRLSEATHSDVRVKVEGAGWAWPEFLDGVQAGEEVVVYAELPAGRPLDLRIGGRVAPAGRTLDVGRPLLARAAAQAKIARLLRVRDNAPSKENRDRLQAEIVELSVRERVLSPFTSLLVLETEGDFQRYGIDRRALASIMTVEEGAVRLLSRGPGSVVVARPPAPEPQKSEGLFNRLSRSFGSAVGGAADTLASAAGVGGGAAPMGVFGAAPRREADDAPRDRMLVAAAGDDGAVETEALLSAPAAPPAPEAGFGGGGAVMLRVAANVRAERVARSAAMASPPPAMTKPPMADPYTGRFKDVLDLVGAGRASAALSLARRWVEEAPGDVLALTALGEALEASGDRAGAARAYGSIIDLFPDRADLRRYAGARLERLRGEEALALAADTYRKAAEQRPDHPSSHRLLGFALLKRGLYREAFEALEAGVLRDYPSGRFRGAERILREDLGLAASAWLRSDPDRRAEVLGRMSKAGAVLEDGPSVRFVLSWETDANDVDFHIRDAKGGHAYYSSKALPSGGELYEDVTTGYGPECFTVRAPKAKRAGPYTLQAHYYSRGPMGYGMGKLQVVEHDGLGRLSFQDRPFVVMTDGAYVDLGKY